MKHMVSSWSHHYVHDPIDHWKSLEIHTIEFTIIFFQRMSEELDSSIGKAHKWAGLEALPDFRGNF